ncbi:MAG: hypothetical protein Kilf2KO_39240 [Rhodospirillales bacterium]
MTPDIRAAFDSLPPETRGLCEALRGLALQVAEEHPEIGPLTETLKWGEPAYLTEATGAGSTLRIWRSKGDRRPALFVNCQTTLVEQFKAHYPATFDYRDSRAVVLTSPVEEVREALKHCMALTFTYRLRKRRPLQSPHRLAPVPEDET